MSKQLYTLIDELLVIKNCNDINEKLDEIMNDLSELQINVEIQTYKKDNLSFQKQNYYLIVESYDIGEIQKFVNYYFGVDRYRLSIVSNQIFLEDINVYSRKKDQHKNQLTRMLIHSTAMVLLLTIAISCLILYKSTDYLKDLRFVMKFILISNCLNCLVVVVYHFFKKGKR